MYTIIYYTWCTLGMPTRRTDFQLVLLKLSVGSKSIKNYEKNWTWITAVTYSGHSDDYVGYISGRELRNSRYYCRQDSTVLLHVRNWNFHQVRKVGHTADTQHVQTSTDTVPEFVTWIVAKVGCSRAENFSKLLWMLCSCEDWHLVGFTQFGI